MHPLLDLARRVQSEAAALGIPTALIGGLALAHHGYVRATVDVDLASRRPVGRGLGAPDRSERIYFEP